jgi:hypothetical protein
MLTCKMLTATFPDMTQRSAMTKFRLFWEAADAVLARRGKPRLTYDQATAWFDSEVTPEVVGELRTFWDDHYFEERLTRSADEQG